ncbi:GntP family gluconate:H+ symporter [Amycolatopsis sulphurea]|uniref:GntP family gluconate:H+ symporter n=1 Tax=Amycolatopsis sulphurea TaxID=76022 RepID=A0A2A9F9R6_9PSEU|nr:GntP family gluconate:H+ symporter [Amycolatopsis sulphurea]
MTVLAAGWTGHDARLIAATVLAIALIVVQISKVKLHPLL